MPSSNDDEDSTDAIDDPPPRPLPQAMLRPAAVAFAGLLAFTTGLHGWWYVLSGDSLWFRYTVASLLGDLALLFGGLFALLVAAGGASRRLG